MEWFALLIPILGVIISYYFFKSKIVLWEYFLAIIITIIFILVFKLIAKTIITTDTEYHGFVIVSAKYFEEWETWVSRTCTREVPCGQDSNGRTQYCTETYDCSYCDRNSEYWMVYDNLGNSYNISKRKYNELQNKWEATPIFIELNRDISKHFGCGKDGDAYEIKWNGLIESSESSVREKTYTNKIQASHSAFKLPYISKKEAEVKQLYNYPKIYDFYKQKVILGLDSIYLSKEVQEIETLFQFFNGKNGPRSKVKLFILLFYNKSQQISFYQEAYWSGGNQNELVICIGLDKTTKQINWVRPFSWTNHKRILVDIREELMELKYFKPIETYNLLTELVSNKDVHRSFKTDFNYLTVDLPKSNIIVIYIVSLIITIGINIWCYHNNYEISD